MTEKVILVDENDSIIGEMDKIEAHEKGLLHRAFSIFIISEDNQKMLIQQRAFSKYHSAGLWANACCSHPQPHEDMNHALSRKSMQELGFSIPVTKLFDFTYKTEFENGLIEHELDHVFVGYYHHDHEIHFNKEEVHAVKWIDIADLESKHYKKEEFTVWFNLAIGRVLEHIKNS